jgi:uncharacterized protein (TIGR03437 family)
MSESFHIVAIAALAFGLPAIVLADTRLGPDTGAAGVPSISAVMNNYSNVLPGAPNYGIAPGALIVIYGSNLAAPGSQAVLQNPARALPLTLNGCSVSITVYGQTVQPAIYYAIPSQVAVVLPSYTPVGAGTITVSYNQQVSVAASIQVVPSAFGFDAYGGALAVATDNSTGKLITTGNSAKPGETVTFWGAGVGADTNNTDVSPPTNFDNLNGITAFYLGGVPVPILYQGRSAYQGVDQIDVTIPPNAPTGCAVSVSAMSGGMVSNIVSIPIAAGGGTCVDPIAVVNPARFATLSEQSTVKFAQITVAEISLGGGAADPSATANFVSISGSEFTGFQSVNQPSLGSCFVTQSTPATSSGPFALTGLNAGSLSVQGPSGTQALPLTSVGTYYANPLPAGFIPSSGGTFTFTGTGGSDAGAFTANASLPTPLVWGNSGSLDAVTRSRGVLVDWTGGGSGFVEINGSSQSAGGAFLASFVCNVSPSAGTFTVPPSVLLSMPAGAGMLSVSSYAAPEDFSVPGLDFAFSLPYSETFIQATYN